MTVLVVASAVICVVAIVSRAHVAGVTARADAEVAVAREKSALERFHADRAVATAATDARADLAPARVGHRVTVHTKTGDDRTIFGVLVGDYTDRLVLEDAEYVTPAGAQPLPGRQDIYTRDVSWVDVHALVALPDHAPVGAATSPTGAQA